MKKLLITLASIFALTGIKVGATEISCSGSGGLLGIRKYHVYLKEMPSNLSSAILMIKEFTVSDRHFGEFIVKPTFLYSKYLNGDSETKFHFTNDVTHVATVDGGIDLESGTGNIKMTRPRRNIKLSGCELR